MEGRQNLTGMQYLDFTLIQNNPKSSYLEIQKQV